MSLPLGGVRPSVSRPYRIRAVDLPSDLLGGVRAHELVALRVVRGHLDGVRLGVDVVGPEDLARDVRRGDARVEREVLEEDGSPYVDEGVEDVEHVAFVRHDERPPRFFLVLDIEGTSLRRFALASRVRMDASCVRPSRSLDISGRLRAA